MKTSGPSDVMRRSASEATDNVVRVEPRHAVGADSHGRDVEVNGVNQPRLPRSRLQPGAALENDRHHLPLSRAVRARPADPHRLSAPAPHRPAPACGRSGVVAMLSGVVTIITGPASSVENTRAEGGIRRRRSNSTRVSGRRRCTSRTVSSGSSTRTVSEPTAIASTSARTEWAWRSDSSELICVRSPACRHVVVEARRGLHDHKRPMPAS